MTRTSEGTLSREQVTRYERDGIVFPVAALSRAEASHFRGCFEELESRLGGTLQRAPMTHLYFRWAYDLVTHPSILDAVESLIGAETLVQGSLLLCKYPRDPSRVLWHQDGSYSSRVGTPATSAWVALSDSTPEGGCLRVIPGSHVSGPLPHVVPAASDSLLRYDGLAGVDETRAADVALKAGEMSLHQGDLVHGSAPNRSDEKRIGFVVRYVTPRYAVAVNPVVRGRGRERCDHLTLLHAPPRGTLSECITRWEKFLRRRNLTR